MGSETPRTDAEILLAEPSDREFEYIDPEFARTLEREIADLRARLAEAEKDTERLNFIEATPAMIYPSLEHNGSLLHWVFVNEKDTRRRTGILGQTLRDAIDTAHGGKTR